MIILPAIDIKNGKVVRLKQGKFDQVVEYGTDPIAMAQHWADCGASCIHVVDLDGAQNCQLCHLSLISQMAKAVNVPIEVGGGIRFKEDIIQLLQAGVARVIIGTKVIEDQEFLTELLSQWPEQIAVSLDCKGGKIALKGWTAVTDMNLIDYAKELEQLGLRYLIYTDIKRDGMLSGPDVLGLKKLLNSVEMSIIASGGISSLKDLKELAALKNNKLWGVIVGKALYEKTLTLAQALELCSQNE